VLGAGGTWPCAGLRAFDVSHMGLFQFSGDNVHLFLNTVTANDVSL
jgi:glycine cleavage system aminomethyltransferase T